MNGLTKKRLANLVSDKRLEGYGVNETAETKKPGEIQGKGVGVNRF